MSLGTAVAQVAPLYNLAFVVIAVTLFIKLFKTPIKNKKVYLAPWKWIFVALLIFVVEEILTILRAAGVINISLHINGFFELVIIAAFIYALLLQKEHLKKK